MIFKPGWILFATDDSKEGVLAARAWLAEHKLKPDQVRLFALNGQTLVEAIKPVEITPPLR